MSVKEGRVRVAQKVEHNMFKGELSVCHSECFKSEKK